MVVLAIFGCRSSDVVGECSLNFSGDKICFLLKLYKVGDDSDCFVNYCDFVYILCLADFAFGCF